MVYIGVSEKGGYAVIDGERVETRNYKEGGFIEMMMKRQAHESRVVIEMSRPGYETVSKNPSLSEVAYKLCRMKGLPCMVVKPGTWQRELKITDNAASVCSKLFPGVGFEKRTDKAAIIDALLLAEYEKISL